MRTTDRLIAGLAVPCLLLGLMPLQASMAANALPQDSAATVPQRFESTDSPISVMAEIVASKSQVAVPMRYSVTIDAPRGTTVVLPPIAGVFINETDKLSIVDQPLGDFLLTGVEVSRDVPTGAVSGSRRTRLLLDIESLKPGLRQVPALEVVYRLADKAGGSEDDSPDSVVEGTVRIPALGIEIESVLVAEDEPDKFRDIKTAVAAPLNDTEPPSPLLALVFVGLGMLFVGFFWWARRGKCAKPEQWAFQRIGELKQAYDSNQISTAEVYGDLSVVLRDYIQSACNTAATALCTSEVLDLLSRDGFDAGVISGARSILDKADVSKFSPDVGALGEDGKSPFDQARRVIDESVRLQNLARQRLPKAGTPAVQATIETGRKAEA